MPSSQQIYQHDRVAARRRAAQPASIPLARYEQRRPTAWPAAVPASELLQLQRTIGNHAVGRLLVQAERRPIPTHSRVAAPVIQRATALQTFKGVLHRIAGEIGGRLGSIADELTRFNKLDDPDRDTHELKAAFASAWEGTAQDETEPGDDRVMLENLIQNGWYGARNALKQAGLERDKQAFLRGAQSAVHQAFENALFFRAERTDSNASQAGYLQYNPTKHGPKGSASAMPGEKADDVIKRATGYLFVTKNRAEAKAYAEKAQGGGRELLTMIASRNEVGVMLYDVDSGGYKTESTLTGIVTDTMTDDAVENLNTWLPPGGKVAKGDALDGVLREFVRR